VAPHTPTLNCYHCGLPVPAGTDIQVEISGSVRSMCCPGCAAVAQTIVGSGLSEYYRYRDAPAANPQEIELPEPDDLARYDRPALQAELVRDLGDGKRAITLAVEGMRCAACVWLIERRLTALAGVVEARVLLASERCDLVWRAVDTRLSTLLTEISRLGYRAYPYRPDVRASLRRAEYRRSLVRIGIAGLASMQVMMFATSLYAGSLQGMTETYRVFLRWVSALVTLPVLLVSARPFFDGALRDLRNRRLGMDVPVALATLAAYVASLALTVVDGAEVYYDSVCMFVFFLLVGRFFEARARDRASQAVENVLRAAPAMASRMASAGGDACELVSVHELRPGDCVLVKPGETIPADGVVVDGRGAVNEAMLTGEHWPHERTVGDTVTGGTQNGECPLVVRVTRTGADSVLATIVGLVERAGGERPAVAQLADRAAAYFVPAVLVASVGVALAWWPVDPARAFSSALAVLVVTCPCALSLATPAALTAATSGLLARGLMVARGHVLESLAAATHVVFDKTGTLTLGRFRISRCVPVADRSEATCRALARALESRSEHPIARAFDPSPRAAAIETVASAVTVSAGRGVEGCVGAERLRVGAPDWVAELAARVENVAAPDSGNWVLLGGVSGPLCWFELQDAERPEARAAVSALNELGIDVQMVSGDRSTAVRTMADRLGITTFVGGAAADEKLAHVRRLQERGAVVVMVGDGVNDAPGLGGAHVSIAMGGGTDLAMSRADSVLLREDLGVIVAAIRQARKTRRVIVENLAWATLYNVVAIPLAALGMIPPYWAAAGMSASSLIVVANALRLSAVGERSRSATSEARRLRAVESGAPA
jgi:P-type Cu2+ transporter